MDLNAYALEFVVVAIYVGIPLVVLRLLVRAANRPGDDSSTILRRRFAKGEISQAEFETAKRILGS
ncbi:MAG TPA: SHOCT domain-containing protein [Candidatus Limnocylindrales bacterium]